MKGTFPIDKFQSIETPFYYYDTELLWRTLNVIHKEVERYERFEVHYAIKANANPKLLNIICQAGLGADCVSGGEIEAASKAGFPANKIVYAGVGRAIGKFVWAWRKAYFALMLRAWPNLKLSSSLLRR